MSEDRQLAYRTCGSTAAIVALIAVVAWVLAGPDQAAGALAGGAITIGNFLWLRWTTGLALRRGPAEAGDRSGGPLRRGLWVAASGVRFGIIAAAFGILTMQGWLGLTGLLVALTALPVTVVAEGIRTARAA